MLFLKNGFGDELQPTKPIVLYHPFMVAFYNIEQNFHRKEEKFLITKSGHQKRYRQMNHITNADIQTVLLLHAVSHATTYRILNVTHSALHEALCQWFEDPISLQDLINSLHKLELHGLITYEARRFNGRFDLQLQHIKKGEENPRFVVVHPVVFSQDFANMSISHKKIYFALLMQTGSDVGKTFTRKMDNVDHENVMFRGLKQLTHKKQASDVKTILLDLLSVKMGNNVPLIVPVPERELIEKHRRRFYKAQFQLHPSYVMKHEEGTHYHFPIKPKVKYRRFAGFLEELLESSGLKEYMTENYENLFHELLDSLKTKGKTITRFVIERLKNYVKKKYQLPKLSDFAFFESRIKTRSLISGTAVKEGIYDWIAPDVYGVNEEDRLFEFANALSAYSLQKIRYMFKKARKHLLLHYSKPAEFTLEDYISEHKLNRLPMMDLVRNKAYHQRVHPQEYLKLEDNALKQLNKGKSFDSVIKELLREVDRLNPVETMPDVDNRFKLEEYVIRFA